MLQAIKNKLDTFLKENTGLPKIIVIYGPTACGKTGLSIEVAKYLESEIISVDARQIYRYLNIGTGKATQDEMQGVPHHMIDIIDPDEVFSVVDFREKVEKLEIWNQGVGSLMSEVGRIPILCGGTGLYIDSLIYERTYPPIEADWTLRDELEAFRLSHGNEALWEKLNILDPDYAKILHPNNYRYVMRGIEVFEKTGKSKADIIDVPKLKYDTLFLTPFDGDREKLYEKINVRVQEMFNNGLIEEVNYIIESFGSACPGLKTIGYKEVVEHLEGKTSLDECISLVQQHNRNYAKRQLTWNKKYEKGK